MALTMESTPGGNVENILKDGKVQICFFVKMHFPLGFYHLKIFTNVSQDFKIFAAIMCLAMLDSLIFQSLEIYLELYLLIQVGNYSHQGKDFFLTNVHIAIICCQQFCSNTFCL